jgi:hypothetical protein
MKLNDLFENDVAPPVLYTVLKELIKKGIEVRLAVKDRHNQWVDGYIDDVDWNPNFPDIIGIHYSIHNGFGDYVSGFNTEIEDVDNWTVTYRSGENRWLDKYWWLHRVDE